LAKRDDVLARAKSTRRAATSGPTAVDAVEHADMVDASRSSVASDDQRTWEARYRALVLATGQITWTAASDGADGDGRDWCLFTGQTLEATGAWGWLEALHPDDRARAASAWKGALAAKSLYEIDYRVRRHDGEYRWLLVRGVPVLEADGSVREWVGTATDISERKRAEDALRASKTRLAAELADTRRLQHISGQLIREGDLSALYEQILDAAIAITHADMGSMQMLYPDKNALRLLAWKGFDPASAAFWEWVSVESSASCGMALATSERVIVPDVETADFMAGTEDLDYSRLSGIRAVQSTPLVSRGGQLVGMISTHWRESHQPAEGDLRLFDVLARQAADLIERTQAEEAAAHLAAIVASTSDAIASKTLDGIITSWNASAERMFGYTAREIVGQSVLLLIPPDRHAEEEHILARLRAGERIEHYETVRVTKDGRPLDVSLTISPVRDSAGAIIGASKIVRDITERKRAEEALRASELALQEANQHKDEFLGIASHELRTPLTSAKANIQIVARRLAGAIAASDGDAAALLAQLVPLQRQLERGEAALDRLGRLVADLLDLSRIQAGKLELRPERMDLVTVVREAVEEETAAWPDRDVRLEGLAEGLAGDAPAPGMGLWVDADPDRVRQVVINYLSNALKYAPPDRPIAVRVAVCTGEGVARVAVRDEGPGLTPDQQARLFERFYRVEGISRLQGSGIGLGLGLSICREIVERHGGTVGVESVPGDGATFWFTLPLA
jgi:PAS domain S-box-containing protein